jgi:hypothetical protein
MSAQKVKGPIEEQSWADSLEALVVDPVERRIHGYDVESDLAHHYRFSDLVYLSLVGELPDDTRSRAFEIALSFLLPMCVARAPVHATVLAGHCEGPVSGVVATAAVTIVDELTDLLATDPAIFEPSNAPLPEPLCATSEEERASVARLATLLNAALPVPLLARNPRRELALVAVLRACGLDTPMKIAAAVAVARIPSAIAEAEPRRLSEFLRKYPLLTPSFAYER